MSDDYNHILWKITHKEVPGKVSYIMASIEHISPTQQREITKKIVKLDEFKSSPLIITDRNFHLDDHPVKRQELLECTSVAKAIAIYALLQEKQVYSLDSDQYFNDEKALARTDDFTAPSHLIKFGLFAVTAPVSLPLYLIYRGHHKHKYHDLIRDAFINEDINDLASRIYEETGDGTWEHMIKHRNYKWIMRGNHEEIDNPTNAGLYKFLKEESGFIVVPAENLCGSKYGLVSLLRQSGFDVDPVVWQEEDEQLYAKSSEPPEREKRASHHVRSKSV